MLFHCFVCLFLFVLNVNLGLICCFVDVVLFVLVLFGVLFEDDESKNDIEHSFKMICFEQSFQGYLVGVKEQAKKR